MLNVSLWLTATASGVTTQSTEVTLTSYGRLQLQYTENINRLATFYFIFFKPLMRYGNQRILVKNKQKKIKRKTVPGCTSVYTLL